jgi:hypothetical protein
MNTVALALQSAHAGAIDWVQLFGAVVTLVGLAHAYTRARFGLGLWQWIWSKLRRRGPHQTIAPTGIPSAATFGFGSLSADGYAPFALDTTKPIDDQLAQLATYVRELRALFSPIGQQIVRLDRDIADVRQHAETVAAQALTDAKSDADKRLEDIDAEQTRAEVLDLRIAIVGLGITVVGLALALWA